MPAGDEPEAWARDPELYYQPSTRPGAKLPHAWLVGSGGRRLSTLDLVGDGQFSVLTGPSGQVWAEAARTCRERTGIPLRCLLVRPDGYIGWRCEDAPADAAARLERALSRILSHG
jgi:2,4-dichlorophenol 6-monooxygenase